MEVGFPISVVAAQLGVPAPTLRAWQDRYGLGASTRSPGGHRRYTNTDIHRLREMRALMATGVAPADAARVILALPDPHPDPIPVPVQHLPLLAARPQPEPGDTAPGDRPAPGRAASDGPAPAGEPHLANGTVSTVSTAGVASAALQQAARGLDGPAAAALLRDSLATRGSCTTWALLVRPALRALECRGRPHARDHAHRVAAEHLLSHLIITTFAAHAAHYPTDHPRHPGSVLLACAPGEQHSLPLTALAAALAETGISSTILGARTPRPALTAALTRTWARTSGVTGRGPDPVTVLVLCLRPHPQQLTVFAPPRRDPDTSGAITWIAAGPGWRTTALPPDVTPVNGLIPALTLIRTTHTAPAPPSSQRVGDPSATPGPH